MANINYGDTIRFVNYYGGTPNGYLGTGGSSTLAGGIDQVGAYANTTDYPSQTLWTITPARGSNKKTGNVYSGDQVTLIAQDKSCLALMTTGADPGPGGYSVATAANANVDGITIGWYVFINSSVQGNVGSLTDQHQIYLLATYNALAAALDTNGAGYNNPFQYLVTGARLLNRDNGSGLWSIVKTN